MPTFEPPIRPEEVPVEVLDVIGYRERGHLSHVGFAWEVAEISHGNEIAIVDARAVRRNSDKLEVHVVGRLRLSRRERKLMTTWLQRQLRARTLAGDFVNAADAQRDRVSGRIVGRAYSCAMLVHECLRQCAGVTLVDLDALPSCERERLIELWGERVVQMAAFRDELPGEGPWPLLLPAHILHALTRADPRAAPLRPTPERWDFP